MNLKMYVLARRDLTPSQQAVQAGHALAQYLIDFSANVGMHEGGWLNGTLIYLGVENEKELKDWIFELDDAGVENSYFVEPDFDNQTTAVAALDYPDKRLEKLFSNLNLL